MSLVLEMCWPHSIQLKCKVTIHTHLSIHYNSYQSITHDPLWPERCQNAVHHGYPTKTEGFAVEQFDISEETKTSSTRTQVRLETWSKDDDLISRKEEHSGKGASRFWMYYTHCLRIMD